MIAARQLKAMLEGNALGLGGSHATEVGHGDLAAMDGESHADQGGGERDDDEHENLGEQTEEADHRRIRVDGLRVRGQVAFGNPGKRGKLGSGYGLLAGLHDRADCRRCGHRRS